MIAAPQGSGSCRTCCALAQSSKVELCDLCTEIVRTASNGFQGIVAEVSLERRLSTKSVPTAVAT